MGKEVVPAPWYLQNYKQKVNTSIGAHLSVPVIGGITVGLGRGASSVLGGSQVTAWIHAILHFCDFPSTIPQ